MDYTSQQIEEKIETLPEDIQDVIYDPDFDQQILGILEQTSVPMERTSTLKQDILMVMVGLKHPKDFITVLSKDLAVPTDQAKKIADVINEAIFKPVRISLRKMYGITDNSDIGGNEKDTPDYPAGRTPQATKIETNPDHMLNGQSELTEISDGKTVPPMSATPIPTLSSRPTTSVPNQTPASIIPKTRQSSFSSNPGSSASWQSSQFAPSAPVNPIETLEEDIKEQVAPVGIASQKLTKPVTLPKQETKFTIPDPKDRTTDPYREAI